MKRERAGTIEKGIRTVHRVSFSLIAFNGKIMRHAGAEDGGKEKRMESYTDGKEEMDKYSLRGKVFRKIREDILSGNYKEKEELKEAAISKALGVSRTPVREALRQLELEGLVNIIPNKGAYVNGISAKDIYDIYVIRSYLEGLCAKWACEHITKAQTEELEEIIYLSDFHIKKEHWDQIFELDNRFHLYLYQASGSRILEHILTDYHHYVERVRKNTLAYGDRAKKANEEHKAILEAVIGKDEEKAEKLANEHIFRSIDNIKNQGLEKLM